MSNPFAPQYHHDTRTAFGYRVRFKRATRRRWVGLIRRYAVWHPVRDLGASSSVVPA